ncbi:MAG: baeS, partial [Chloroflexi bacterium]|nr:baeS [Chloroflexota bacterium]
FRVYPKPIDPVEIISEAVQTMEPLAQKYGQSIEVNVPVDLPEARADPRRTGQVLVNLLSNAIKWNSNGGTIRLSAIQENERVLITVADHGPGIPDDHQAEVFLRFDRTQTRDGRGESGAGLGLSVVKAIIEAQGGQVGAYNQPDGGAAFWFSIPINCSEAEQEELPG